MKMRLVDEERPEKDGKNTPMHWIRELQVRFVNHHILTTITYVMLLIVRFVLIQHLLSNLKGCGGRSSLPEI